MANFFTNLFGRYNGSAYPGATVESMAGTNAGKALGSVLNGNVQQTPANGGTLPKQSSVAQSAGSDVANSYTDNLFDTMAIQEKGTGISMNDAFSNWDKLSQEQKLSSVGKLLGSVSTAVGNNKSKNTSTLYIVSPFSRRTATFLGGR